MKRIKLKEKLRKLAERCVSVFSQEEYAYAEKRKKRINNVFIFLAVLFIGEIYGLFWNSGCLKGLNPNADMFKKAAIAEKESNSIIAGDIYDRNGIKLVENTLEKTEEEIEEAGKGEEKGKVKKEYIERKVSKYIDDYAYTQVLGYTTPAYLVFDVPEEKDDSDGKNEEPDTETEGFHLERMDYRLMSYYSDELYKGTGYNGTKGNSLFLTLDHEMQMEVQRIMVEEMGMDARGGAVVLDVKTGEILSMVALPSFNANRLDESLAEIYDEKNSEEMEKKEISYPITHKGKEEPGSIFKIITTVSLIDNGMEDFVVADKGFQLGGKWIDNDYVSVGDEIDYTQAIARSSNVYFAQAGVALGGEKLDETAKKFMLAGRKKEHEEGEEEEWEPVELDFGTIESNWDLDIHDELEVGQTAFGQGKTLFSTIYGAMVAQTIANDGIMMTPRMVQEIQNDQKKTVYKGKDEVLSKVTEKATADKVTEAMCAATAGYIQDSYRIGFMGGTEEIFQTYDVASKTGTGEIDETSELNNAWVISFAPAYDPQYAVAVNQCDVEKYGSELLDVVGKIYSWLFG